MARNLTLTLPIPTKITVTKNEREGQQNGGDVMDQGGDEFVSTPAGFSRASQSSVGDVSRMLSDNMEELERMLAGREFTIQQAMEEKDACLRTNFERQMGSLQERILEVMRSELQQHRRGIHDAVSIDRSNKNAPQDDNTNFTEQWEAARAAAAANVTGTNCRSQSRFAAPPASMGDRFGATSPTGNFRGRTINLQSVDEENSQDGSRDSVDRQRMFVVDLHLSDLHLFRAHPLVLQSIDHHHFSSVHPISYQVPSTMLDHDPIHLLVHLPTRLTSVPCH
jgi:hypothetical protein